MITNIRKLQSDYLDAEMKLINALFELENGDADCNCDVIERPKIRTIHNGEFPEIVERCLNCGGYVA